MTRENFLEGVNNDTDHRILLWEAIKLTKGKVVEFGSGHGSTPFLREHCKNKQRVFESYEHNEEWAKQTGATLITTDWEEVNPTSIHVLFIDHAPGERRQFDLLKYKDLAKIIVIHDSEPTGAGDYKVRQHFGKFKYCVEVGTNGCWATMLSDTIDITECIGTEWNQYIIFNKDDRGTV